MVTLIHDYWFSLFLIAVFAVWEIIQYNKTQKLIKLYASIFPNSTDAYSYIKEIYSISSDHESALFKNILETLNKYLGENSDQISDYHLMKDVIDRNREVSESEIETIIPFTQYIGLVGTMLGIFVGVYQLVFGDGLDNLMSGSTTALANSGVSELLGGVALAVLTSAIGLGLTMLASFSFKNAKKAVETNENLFLSWIQAEILPNLSTDMTSTLIKMTNNLRSFNETFSVNADKLDRTLAKVNDSYIGQAQLLEAIKDTNITQIVKANIDVYEKLKNCTEEIGMLGDSLKVSRKYLQLVQDLTIKLDNADERAKTWERMGKFFEAEVKQIESRKAAISEAVGTVDEKLQSSLVHLSQSSQKNVDTLAEKIIIQNDKLDKALSMQEQVLNSRLNSMAESLDQRDKRMNDLMVSVEIMMKELPEDLKKYTKELTTLNNIRYQVEQIQKTIVAKQEQAPIVTSEGKVIATQPAKIPMALKIAIYVIGVYALLMICKEIYPVIMSYFK